MRRLGIFATIPCVLLCAGAAWADMPAPRPHQMPEVFLTLFFLAVVVAAVGRLLLFGVRRLFFRARSAGARPFRWFRVDLCVAAAIVAGIFLYAELTYTRGRRRPSQSEAKSNLGAIRSTEVAYYAEWDTYVANQPLTPLADRRRHPEKVRWDTTTRFSILGFAPEGDVYYSYALDGPPWPAGSEGFTARAEGDLDGDGAVATYSVGSHSNEIVKTGAPF